MNELLVVKRLSVFILYSKHFEYIADVLRLYSRNTLNIQPMDCEYKNQCRENIEKAR